MQELMCYVGQQMVFKEASELLSKLKGVDINSMQIERVCHHYGGILEESNNKMVEQGKKPNVSVKGK